MSSSVGPSQATSYDSQGATERKIMQISATKVNFTKKMRIIFFQQNWRLEAKKKVLKENWHLVKLKWVPGRSKIGAA